MSELTNTILSGGVAVALISLIGQLIMWYIKDRSDSSEDESTPEEVDIDGFEDRIEIQHIIDRVITNSSVNRFLILKTENGGGKPRLGSHLYASVMYEAITNALKSVKNDYQRLLVDDIYVRMLSDIGPGTPNKLKVSEMKDGILKNIYKVEGVTYSEVHYVGETETAFVYLSVASAEENNTFDDPIDRVEIEIAISKIRNIFEEVVEGND